MDLSAKGARFVRVHEGFVANYYLDPVRIPTIGIGFTWRSTSFREWWTKNKPGVTFGPGASMTRIEAEDALRYLCSREYGAAVNKFLGRRKVPQHVFDGMVSPCYNLGPGSLKWKWAAAIKAGDYATGAALLRNTGTTARGVRLAGLVRRREEEALLIETGHYTGIDETITLDREDYTSKPADAMADGALRRRERGPAVAELIRDLSVLGYYNGKVDDIFGPGTESAVLAFQREHGLKADGIAGKITLRAIAGKRLTQQKMLGKPPERRSVPSKPIPKGKAAAAAGGAIAAGGAVIASQSPGFTSWLCGWLPFCQ
ncbi:MAG: peptidoglycan-binding protein [Alphaproteobacteria bacterium]|nr:peptidoglycan-binding protein [Alphaproteobacteria bacterium]